MSSPSPLPPFAYRGPLLVPAQLRYRPHPDIIHPSVVASGPHWQNPLAPYYLYYAPHDAPGGICLALAERPEGPWREYEHNPLIGRDWTPHYQVSHVSSPHALWHDGEGCLFLYFHGENDITRYARSRDGVTFEYGGVALAGEHFRPALTEASYARVFALADGSFAMLLMGCDAGTRHVYLARSRDGRRWEPQHRPFISPPPGTNQMGPGWYFAHGGRHYVLAFANRSDGPMFAPISDLYLYETDAALRDVQYLGLFMDHTAAGPDNQRLNDPCLLATPEALYLYLNAGRRLHQYLALAVARQ